MSPVIKSPNLPLNLPPLEALELISGPLTEDQRNTVLSSHLSDDLSGLRDMGRNLSDLDGWKDIACPKQEIGDYVESLGVRVPKRYSSVEEAISAVRKGTTVIARSEHPQEYANFSGLLDSKRLDTESADIVEQLLQRGIRLITAINSIGYKFPVEPLNRYLALSGQTRPEFFAEMSYSFWEYIDGTNVMVTADDAIEDRYHIAGYESDKGTSGWVGNSEGLSEFGSDDRHSNRLIDSQARIELVDLYEQVRNLPKFSKRNCPLMEFQIGEDGTIWFLQYHKGRTFRQAPETISNEDYPSSEGWYKAESVRGALGSLVTLKTALWYPEYPEIHQEYKPDVYEEASFDWHWDLGFSEFMSPKRIAYVSYRGREDTYSGLAEGGHTPRSKWFRPNAALSIDKATADSLIPEPIKNRLVDVVHREHGMGRVVLDYASDGMTGFIRLNPESEQPLITNY